jgi:acyl-CoA dehydrogenase
MIDFKLTEEQVAIRNLAREFAQKEIVPVAAEYDRAARHPQPIVEKAHAVGLMHLNVPEEYGGGGLGSLEECLVAEELGAGCVGIGTTILANALAMTPILIAATPEQMREHLPPHCAGPNLAAFNLTEPGAGSDAGAMRTRAQRAGDEYVITGTKCFISNGGVASLHTVFAVTAPERGVKGISAFIVPASLPGVKPGKKEDKMGQRATDTHEVIFEEVRVPARYRLGDEGDGFKIAMMTLDKSRAQVGAAAVGLARAAMEAAIRYAKERVQFSQPIANFQAIQFMLADMAIKVETARLMCWRAAWLTDHGQRNTYEAAIAKCYATDVAMQVTTDAVQVFGGYGYMKDYPVEKYMRDAKLMQIYEGTNQIQRYVISRALLG